jgi:hypothetical protein
MTLEISKRGFFASSLVTVGQKDVVSARLLSKGRALPNAPLTS